MSIGEVKEFPAAKRKRLLRQFSKVARAGLGTGLMGTLITFPSILAADLQRHKTSLYGTPLSIDGLQDLVGSLLIMSTLPGTWLTASLAMRLGRRKGMILNGVVATLGWLGIALIPYPAGILFSRCVSGMAIGGLGVTINAYVIELCDAEMRGRVSFSLDLTIMLGQVLTVVLGYAARYYTVAFINALVPAAFVAFVVWLPESPSILVLKGKDEKAVEVLHDLRWTHANIQEEIESYKSLNKTQQERGVWRSLLQPSVVKLLLVVSTLFVIVSLTGFMVVNANSIQMLEAAKTSVDSRVASIVLMVVQFAGGLVWFFIVDRIGRRNVLYLGFSIMSVALAVMTGYCGILQSNRILHINGDTRESPTPPPLPHHDAPPHSTTTPPGEAVVEVPLGSSWGWMPLACLAVFQTAGSLGVNAVCFLLIQEYFPTSIRSQANGVCITVKAFITFACLQLYTSMVTHLTQAGLYGFYCAFCLLGLPFTAFCIREMMGEAVG